MHDAGEEHQCEYCHKIFHVKGVLSKHIINDHSETMSKPYPCNICYQSFVSSERLRFHTRKYHDSSMKCERRVVSVDVTSEAAGADSGC